MAKAWLLERIKSRSSQTSEMSPSKESCLTTKWKVFNLKEAISRIAISAIKKDLLNHESRATDRITKCKWSTCTLSIPEWTGFHLMRANSELLIPHLLPWTRSLVKQLTRCLVLQNVLPRLAGTGKSNSNIEEIWWIRSNLMIRAQQMALSKNYSRAIRRVVVWLRKKHLKNLMYQKKWIMIWSMSRMVYKRLEVQSYSHLSRRVCLVT